MIKVACPHLFVRKNYDKSSLSPFICPHLFSEYGGGFLAGLGIIIFGAIGSRIWCELLIVLFKIHENLQKIANKSE